MDFLRHDTTRCCTAISEAGTLRWDGVAGEVSLFSAETNEWQTLVEKQPDRDASYRDQIKLFLAAIPSVQMLPNAATGADGLAVLRLIDAARKSAESSGQVTSISRGTTE